MHSDSSSDNCTIFVLNMYMKCDSLSVIIFKLRCLVCFQCSCLSSKNQDRFFGLPYYFFFCICSSSLVSAFKVVKAYLLTASSTSLSYSLEIYFRLVLCLSSIFVAEWFVFILKLLCHFPLPFSLFCFPVYL